MNWYGIRNLDMLQSSESRKIQQLYRWLKMTACIKSYRCDLSKKTGRPELPSNSPNTEETKKLV